MARVLALVAALALAACQVGPDFHPPGLSDPDRFLPEGRPADTAEAQGVSQSFDPALDVSPSWWTLFGSDELNELVRTGVGGAPSLASARAALRQGEAGLKAGAGVFLPGVQAAGGALRERESSYPVGLGRLGAFGLVTASAAVSYPLDLFGGERRGVEALAAQRDADRALYGAAYLTLTANLVNTAIAEAAYREEIAAVRRVIAFQEEELAITKGRVASGVSSYAAALSVQSAIAANAALIPSLEQRAAAAEDLLAALSGRSPAVPSPPPLRLASLTLPADLPLSLPSQLLGRRPDVLAAEASLHAASAQIGVATAAMLPSVTLSAEAGGQGDAAGRLFGAPGSFWSLGAGLAAPIFEGGALRQRRRAAVAAYDKAAADYRAVTLGAFQQVADVLRGLAHDAEALAADERAVEAASEAESLGRSNEAAGLLSPLDVLQLDVQLEEALLERVQATAQRYQDTVALYVALGGGWSRGRTAGEGSTAAGRPSFPRAAP